MVQYMVNDERFDDYDSAEEYVTEMIDELYGAVEVAGLTFDPSQILRECDPVAWRCILSDEIEEVEDDEDDEGLDGYDGCPLCGDPIDYCQGHGAANGCTDHACAHSRQASEVGDCELDSSACDCECHYNG